MAPESLDIAIKYVEERCASLASFLSERAGRGPIKFEEEFVPSCATPWNERLHSLALTEGVIVKDKAHVNNFIYHLGKARFFSIDFHGVDVANDRKDRIGLVAFCLRTKIYFIMPELFPETVGPIGEALRRDGKPTFTFRWDWLKKQCTELFDWTPSEVIQAEVVANESSIPTTLDAMVEKVVGGTWCRRASNFGGTVIPSAVALSHRAIRVTLIYEFVVKMRGLRQEGHLEDRRENRREDRREARHEGHREPHGDARRRKRDDEGGDGDRHSRKYSRVSDDRHARNRR